MQEPSEDTVGADPQHDERSRMMLGMLHDLFDTITDVDRMRPGSVTGKRARALGGELALTFLDRETCQALGVRGRASFVLGIWHRLDDAQERDGQGVAPSEL